MKTALPCALALAGSLWTMSTLSLLAAGPRTFSFAGHTHEVEAPLAGGVVHVDAEMPSRSDVRLEFNAAAIRVTGKGESADDAAKVQQTMLGEQVLDVKKFPTITFESTSIDARNNVTGKFTIKQSDFGITPISRRGSANPT